MRGRCRTKLARSTTSCGCRRPERESFRATHEPNYGQQQTSLHRSVERLETNSAASQCRDIKRSIIIPSSMQRAIYAVRIRHPAITPTLSKLADRMCQTVIPMIPPAEAPLSPGFVGAASGGTLIGSARGRFCNGTTRSNRQHSRWHLHRITTAVTGPPPNDYDFKTRVIGGSRSLLC
jgi:hypothetical protein